MRTPKKSRRFLRKSKLSADCINKLKKGLKETIEINEINDQLNKHLRKISDVIDHHFYTGQTDKETRRKKSLQNLLDLKPWAVKKAKKGLNAILILQKRYKRIVFKRCINETFN